MSHIGKAANASTREPGDLPSTVVTRAYIGRGVLMESLIPHGIEN